MYLASEVSAQPLGGARVKTGMRDATRTCIFLEFRIRGLKEDLDTVKRGNDRFCLKRWVYVLHVSETCGKAKSVCDARHIQQHHQLCRSESLGPQF
jgi:hypothetical protein